LTEGQQFNNVLMLWMLQQKKLLRHLLLNWLTSDTAHAAKLSAGRSPKSHETNSFFVVWQVPVLPTLNILEVVQVVRYLTSTSALWLQPKPTVCSVVFSARSFRQSGRLAEMQYSTLSLFYPKPWIFWNVV
jgi:hypothetical protein